MNPDPHPDTSSSAPRTPPPIPSTRLSRRTLLALLIAYCLGIWLLLLDPPNGWGNAGLVGNVGSVLYWGVPIAALALDTRAFLSLNGLIRWSALGGFAKLVLVCCFVFVFVVMLPIYLVRALAASYQITRQNLGVRLTAGRRWYASRSPRLQAGVVAGTLAAILTFCSITGVAIAHHASSGAHAGAQIVSAATNTPEDQALVSAYPSPTFAPTIDDSRATPAPTITPIPTDTPIPQPTDTPPQAPTATPIPQPTNTPTPQCDYGGAPPNPWCYTFNNTGKLIYSPPGNFCGYFNCIPSFWKYTNGYVVECYDGTYSHSGGVSGACSSLHGGELRPLYQP